MTSTCCPHCNKATYAYSDRCGYCKKLLGDSRPLLGFGGSGVNWFICVKCANVNGLHDTACQACGSPLRPPFKRQAPKKKHVTMSNNSVTYKREVREALVLEVTYKRSGKLLEMARNGMEPRAAMEIEIRRMYEEKLKASIKCPNCKKEAFANFEQGFSSRTFHMCLNCGHDDRTPHERLGG